jgi:hypothetical protein
MQKLFAVIAWDIDSFETEIEAIVTTESEAKDRASKINCGIVQEITGMVACTMMLDYVKANMPLFYEGRKVRHTVSRNTGTLKRKWAEMPKQVNMWNVLTEDYHDTDWPEDEMEVID